MLFHPTTKHQVTYRDGHRENVQVRRRLSARELRTLIFGGVETARMVSVFTERGTAWTTRLTEESLTYVAGLCLQRTHAVLKKHPTDPILSAALRRLEAALRNLPATHAATSTTPPPKSDKRPWIQLSA